MRKEIKAGLTLWIKVTNLKYAAVQFMLCLVSGCAAVLFAAPVLYKNAEELSFIVSGNTVILVLTGFSIIVFGVMMKRIVYEAYERNRDLFYALAVSKRTGCICTILQQFRWYGFTTVILLAVCDRTVVPTGGLILAYTVFFIMVFRIYYSFADAAARKHGLCECGSQAGRSFRRLTPQAGKFRSAAVRSGRAERRRYSSYGYKWELVSVTFHRLYKLKSLAAGKVVLILFLLYCGNARLLCGSVFCVAEAFLILCNDGYWRNESRNFQYFSSIGIPVSRYLKVHILAGIGFNLIIPLVFFYSVTGDLGVTAVSFCLLAYLLIFWYLVQVYVYLTAGREREILVELLDLTFLAIALLPPAGLLAMLWMYQKISHKWRNGGCFP